MVLLALASSELWRVGYTGLTVLTSRSVGNRVIWDRWLGYRHFGLALGGFGVDTIRTPTASGALCVVLDYSISTSPHHRPGYS